MLTDEQRNFLDSIGEPEWTGQWLAERLAAGDERVKIRLKGGSRRQLTFNGKDIESAIRYLSPKLTDWLDSRHYLKR